MVSEKILSGLPVAQAINESTRLKITLGDFTPNLAVLFLGENADDLSYRVQLKKSADLLGVTIAEIALPADVTAAKLRKEIQAINADHSIHGVLIQTIRDAKLREVVLHTLHIDKDAEGILAHNFQDLEYGTADIVPCTAGAVRSLILAAHKPEELQGKEAVIINSSPVIGIPLFLMLQQLGMTTTTCNRYTKDLATYTKRADLIVTATGKRGIITAESLGDKMPSIFDVSIIRENGHIVGDVIHSDELFEKVHCVTPVPGGVGPVTVATLLAQCVHLCEKFKGKVREHRHHEAV
ncbi:MAG TPA: bifunctional 5,10-methylenetetrahydrofolate dehydrogenase/5,10-methenyltetrahydrofolate cyclohydrolase [Planktothrix sp.]